MNKKCTHFHQLKNLSSQQLLKTFEKMFRTGAELSVFCFNTTRMA